MKKRAKTRLFIAAPFTAGAAIDLAPEQARHLGSVLRMGVGDPVAVFNGRDGEWLAQIEALKKGRGRLELKAQVRPQTHEPGPVLIFAPLKKAAQDFVVEKATELGVSQMVPAITAHTDVVRLNVDRLRANACAAAEQCGRLTVPTIADPARLSDILAEWSAQAHLLVMDETGQGQPLTDSLSVLADAKADVGSLAVLIGPEGGFAKDELDAMAELAFVTRLNLGPRILRAETAAVAALSCVQAWLGDWRSPPPPRHSR